MIALKNVPTGIDAIGRAFLTVFGRGRDTDNVGQRTIGLDFRSDPFHPIPPDIRIVVMVHRDTAVMSSPNPQGFIGVRT